MYMRQDETDSDNDDTDHAVSPTSSSSSWRGRNESGTITARARTSTNEHESDKDKTQQSSSGTETEYILSSSVFRDYVKPILMEDSQETIDELSRKFGNWFREETDFHEELIKHYCEKEEFDKVNIFMAQWTAVTQFFREQVHLIRLHCDCIEILAGEERTSSQMNEKFHEDDNIEHSLNCQTDEQSDEESPETANNAFLPRSNVVSHQDEADSYSPNSQTEDDDNQEDDDMTYMLSLISDIERRMEELRNSLDVDETDPDLQNDLTESEAEDEWFQVVGNSSPMDPESHDIETAGTSYKNGQDSSHLIETTERFSEGQNAQSAKTIEIGTDLTESYRDIYNLKTVESNKTILDLSGDLSTGIMFGLGHRIEDLVTCEPSQQNPLIDSHEETEKEWSVIEDSSPLSDAEPQEEEAVREINGNDENERHPMDRSGESPETCTKPFPQQSNTVSYDGAVIVNATEVETVTEHQSVVNEGRSSETIFGFKPQKAKRVKPEVKYRNRQQSENDQILTNKIANRTIWMLQVLKRYIRQHLFKSSKPPLVL